MEIGGIRRDVRCESVNRPDTDGAHRRSALQSAHLGDPDHFARLARFVPPGLLV